MKTSRQHRLTLAALIGMAYWLFGNLYEAVVFSPNWVRDSPSQFTRLHEFFSATGPTLYFVPVTQIAIMLVWVLWWRNRDGELARGYRRAGQSAVALAALTGYIVAAVLPHMFSTDALAQPGSLHSAAWQWNILNVFRMLLTATTVCYLFGAFRKLDRRINPS
ncbi:hypothetical protein DMA12_31730 [Amycolatopsis balhimycina DSM 5908]|uniref:DUF1772 domain-containing protein n=1 Tax=Amycolatopsis balhimycina DSM 5908 TaxID=1081091 RepID=A0A428W735_AMYBA|nr:hypothetical protein [Amycolatopsis balhimycina]RSM38843.1 hypothetical protein DMA12_31730 [Amycolatopsis balhimycina DSM 5908]